MLPKIKIFNFTFLGDKTSSKFHTCDYFEWYRGEGKVADFNIQVYTDNCLNFVESDNTDTYKIAWLTEPYEVLPGGYQYLHNNLDRFNLVITHRKDLLQVSDKFVYCPFGGSWIEKNNWGKYDKSKQISIIASDKKHLVGHQLRYKVAQENPDIHRYGSGFNPIDNKLEALKNYRFSVAIENSSTAGYFTEKILDCFATWTIPIYWGDPDIATVFDQDGILFLENTDLDKVVSDAWWPLNYYESKLPSIERNFNLAQKYICSENRMWEDVLKPLGLVS